MKTDMNANSRTQKIIKKEITLYLNSSVYIDGLKDLCKTGPINFWNNYMTPLLPQQFKKHQSVTAMRMKEKEDIVTDWKSVTPVISDT